jgi:polyisoprenoid-binding protein YceI
VAAGVVAAVLAIGGTFLYSNYLHGDAPERLAVASQATTAATATATGTGTGTGSGESLNGTWTVGGSSQAGYRVQEILFGQDTEAVGRTSAVTGELTVSGSQVSSGSFTVDLTQVTSDEERRDSQFQGRIMETATYPTATFELLEPITLASLPADGSAVTASASGELTLHGTTRQVTVELTVQRSGDGVQASGSIPVTFADYGIANPSFGPVTTGDSGEIEFLLAFNRG